MIIFTQANMHVFYQKFRSSHKKHEYVCINTTPHNKMPGVGILWYEKNNQFYALICPSSVTHPFITATHFKYWLSG